MRNLKTLLFIVAASLTITACKKDKDKKSNTELLTASSWVIVKYEEKEGNGQWQNMFPLFDACSKDDKWVFKTNFSVDYTEGTVACTGNTPNEVLESSTWAFQQSETKLQIENDTYLIEQLDENTFIISYSEINGGITSYTKVTMGH